MAQLLLPILIPPTGSALGKDGAAQTPRVMSAKRMSDALFNVFATKMAGVFIISTCTIGLRTAIIPGWIAIIGYACALLLLLVIANWKWITLVFNLWMLLVSTYILLAEFRSRHDVGA